MHMYCVDIHCLYIFGIKEAYYFPSVSCNSEIWKRCSHLGVLLYNIIL